MNVLFFAICNVIDACCQNASIRGQQEDQPHPSLSHALTPLLFQSMLCNLPQQHAITLTLLTPGLLCLSTPLLPPLPATAAIHVATAKENNEEGREDSEVPRRCSFSKEVKADVNPCGSSRGRSSQIPCQHPQRRPSSSL